MPWAGIEPPSILRLDDGAALLYPHRVHWFQGEPETNKTWTAMLAAKEVLNSGGRVLWIDYEDNPDGFVDRLEALGIGYEIITDADRVTYVRPDEPLLDRHGSATPAAVDLNQILTNSYELAVLDGVTEAMVTEGLDPMSNAHCATAARESRG